MQRDLFGRILAIALENKVDIKQVLEYPLTPVPSSLCHVDGLMNKTPKATLFKNLESRVTNLSPSSVDAYIVDGFFFYIYVWIYQSSMVSWLDTFYRNYAAQVQNELIWFSIVLLRLQ
jgi:hypothetical protein